MQLRLTVVAIAATSRLPAKYHQIRSWPVIEPIAKNSAARRFALLRLSRRMM